VEGLPEPVEAGGRAVLALGSQSPDRNLIRGETVSLDMVDGTCVALSHLGTLEREFFAPLTPETEAVEKGEAEAVPGDTSTAAVNEQPNYFYRDGQFWLVQYEGREPQHIKHLKGMFYISLLLAHPDGKPISSLEMQARLLPTAPPQCVDYYSGMSDKQLAKEWLYIEGTEGDEVIEEQIRKELKKRRRDYQQEYEELQEASLGEEALRIRKDMEDLDDYLKKSEGHAGKVRRRAGAMERARQNVQKNIGRAKDELRDDCPELYAHLSAYIDTRRHCTYTPEHPLQWKTVKGD